jgi:hypothetical protein
MQQNPFWMIEKDRKFLPWFSFAEKHRRRGVHRQGDFLRAFFLSAAIKARPAKRGDA